MNYFYNMNKNILKGSFFGAALGDALGAPFEFHNDDAFKKYTGKLKDNQLIRISRFGGKKIFDYGQVTDDTEMMIILLDNIITNNYKINRDELILNYIEWANNKTTVCMGKNTKNLFKGIKTLRGYNNRYEKINEDNQSNGCLMRSMPLVLVDEKYWKYEISITNPNMICIQGVTIYLNLIKFVQNKTIDDIINYFNDLLNTHIDDLLKETIKNALNKTEINLKENKGWILNSLYCAFYCLLHFNTITDAYEWVILSGGDTDTNACIMGGLFGAYIGYEKFELEQSDNINFLINCTTKNGTLERPDKYKVSHLIDLINLI